MMGRKAFKMGHVTLITRQFGGGLSSPAWCGLYLYTEFED